MGNRREGGGEVADPRIKGRDDESTRESQRLRRGARQMGNGIRVRAMGGTHRGCFYTHIELAALGGLGRCGRCYVGDGLTGPSRAGTVPTVPGHAARQAGVAAHARAWCTGRADPGTWLTGPCRVWVVPLQRAFGRAAVHQARWTSILYITPPTPQLTLIPPPSSAPGLPQLQLAIPRSRLVAHCRCVGVAGLELEYSTSPALRRQTHTLSSTTLGPPPSFSRSRLPFPFPSSPLPESTSLPLGCSVL
jgi:hypothetical protein